MRLPRRRFLIPLVLVALMASFLHFGVFYHMKGWLRGDAYFKGMPTNYWADCLNGDHNTPKWLKTVYSFLGAKSDDSFPAHEVFCTDPTAAGVLLQLAADPANRPEVRHDAVDTLIGNHAGERAVELATICATILANPLEDSWLFDRAVFTLEKLAQTDPDSAVRRIAESALKSVRRGQ